MTARIVVRLTVLGLGLGFACTASNGDPRPESAQTGATQRALLVGVARYAPGGGWWPLHADRDVELIRDALRRQGFASERIAELHDRAATAEGIVAAFERDLIASSHPGDVAVFHYSGHGQRLTDDDGDELDGYDEALAPFDAPREAGAAYRGERHLRDDRLGRLLERLRAKVGSRGNVVVLLDSCFSGTATRGILPVRGGVPIGPPAKASPSTVVDGASGLRDRGADGGLEPSGLAPMVVLSATRFDELAYETTTADKGAVGAFSWAVALALSSPGLSLSYRGLFDEIRRDLSSRRVAQEPQAEGDLDTALFSGRAVRQEPFVEANEILAGGARLGVRPGTLLGINVGSEVEVHRVGARGEDAATRLAFGRVSKSEPQRAEIDLSRPVPEAELRGARVFITARAFGDLRLRVRLAGKAPRPLLLALEKISAVELVTRNEDLEVSLSSAASEKSWVVSIFDRETGARLVGPWSLAPEQLAEALARRLEDLARNRYLRRIRLEGTRLTDGFEIVPVEVTECAEPEKPRLASCVITPLPPERFRTDGGQLDLPLGTYFRVRVLPGSRPAYLALLDLMPDGRIEVIWPPAGAEERLDPGDRKPRFLPTLNRAAPPLGLDALLLVASEEPLDFQPLRSGAYVEPDARRTLALQGPFAPLFDDEAIRRRGRAAFSSLAVGTSLQAVRISAAGL